MEKFKKCKISGCENSSLYKDNGHNGYCRKHHAQMYRYGKILKHTCFDKNEIIDCGDCYEICLYNKAKIGEEQKKIACTKIDKEDLEKVKNYKWGFDGHGYVHARIKGKLIKLHRFILDKIEGYEIDHQNHDKLDNRKRNLRVVTHQQNLMNQKNIKGYGWHKLAKKWEVYINFNGKKIHLGLFSKEQDAIIVRKQAEKKYFGQYAYNG